MADIVLTTLNARYIHAAFGLRYLMANLGPLRKRAALLEFDIAQRPLDIVEALAAQHPVVVGLGVYIWNVAQATAVVAALKRILPEVVVVLGGPEVSYETDAQEIVRLADYVVTGEADLKFAELCAALLAGERPGSKVIAAPVPDLDDLVLPYDLYDERDIAQRIVYVEASRGCPFSCEFCLSSLDIPVRQFPLTPLLEALGDLLRRGVNHFKFVDRTFNLNLAVSQRILEFFLERYRPGLFLHFEMIPDRLPDALRARIAAFPAGALQFEVGIQTFNEAVAALISRRQDYRKLEDNLRFLRGQTGVHVHADLIAGLPGESLESLGEGFDRLVALGPQEIQVGILKRLRGTPIVRHDAEWRMVYSADPPYEVLSTRLIDFPTMQRLRRFARFWDLVANSGHFVLTTPLLWGNPRAASPASSDDRRQPGASPFAAFLRFSDWLFAQAGRQHAIALERLAGLVFEYLTQELKWEPRTVATVLWGDLQGGGRNEPPKFLRPFLPAAQVRRSPRAGKAPLKRQARHLAASP
jgi:radical SAM superfamily enzyme YgiQ (UPF0313 family)